MIKPIGNGEQSRTNALLSRFKSQPAWTRFGSAGAAALALTLIVAAVLRGNVEASIDTPAFLPAEPSPYTGVVIEPSPETSEALPQATDFRMRLPFTRDHEPTGIMPMGETINHPPPSSPWGHVGIDFQWDHQASVVAAVDGEVVEIVSTTHLETGIFNYSVHVVTGEFIVNYTTLESVAPNITVGSEVVIGQLIGLPTPVQKSAERHMIHWEFGTWEKHEPKTNPDGITSAYITSRICPVPYFTDSERERLFRIWQTASYSAKEQFPDLCNGPWKNYSVGSTAEPTSEPSANQMITVIPPQLESLPVLRLPFKTGQEPSGMMPMGETVLHTATLENPAGHPGIDFQWTFRAEIIAAADGKVAEIRTTKSRGPLLYTILVITGQFVVAYDVVDAYSVNPDLGVGSKIVSGQAMGYAESIDSGDGWTSMHWTFGKWLSGSEKPNPEGIVEKYRVEYRCPVPYLSDTERQRLFRVWKAARYPDVDGFSGKELRERFPDVCNGPYKNYAKQANPKTRTQVRMRETFMVYDVSLADANLLHQPF